MPPGDRHLLLVNPSAGGGRVRKLLAAAERALSRHGVEYRRVFTEGIEHGRAQAVAAAGKDQIPVVMSGDGLIFILPVSHALRIRTNERGVDILRHDRPEGWGN